MKGHPRSSTVVLGWRHPRTTVAVRCIRAFHPAIQWPSTSVLPSVAARQAIACAFEPLPKRTLKESVDVLAPFIVELFKPLAFSRWCRLFSRRRSSYRCWRSPTLTRPILGHRPIDQFLICWCMLSSLEAVRTFRSSTADWDWKYCSGESAAWPAFGQWFI